ncbi:MAG: sensor histidine kinase, partial [Burkholderiales bacterium]
FASRAQSGAERSAAFAELTRGIERTRRLVQQLLDMARLEPGERAESLEPLNVAQLVREVVGSYAAQAEALGVDLGVEAPPAVRAIGAASELRSLVANLVDNALRYAPRGSEVTASVQQDGAAVGLSVTDCGPGIAPGERARVFERFHRAAGDATRGSGLGLPIAKAIAERHGGSIALEDAHPGREPRGLAVRVRLPVHHL